MTQLGADPAQLRTLAREFRAEASTISQSQQLVTNELGAAWWKGNDSTRFSEAWHGNYSKSLNELTKTLYDVATILDDAASAQEQISR